MSTAPRVLAKVWLPLDQAVVCVACETVCWAGESTCPDCGRSGWRSFQLHLDAARTRVGAL